MLLSRLKHETLAEHRRLEADLDLLGPRATPESFVEFLVGMYGYLAAWETRADQFLGSPLPVFHAARRKAPALASDLITWGRDPQTIALAPLGPIRTANHLWGSMYVLEGSMLGGQMIARSVQQRWAIENLAYWAVYGSEVARMWRAFGAELEAQTPGEQASAVVAAARQTFCELHDWLCSTKHRSEVSG